LNTIQVYTPHLFRVTLHVVFFQKKFQPELSTLRFYLYPTENHPDNMAKHPNEWYTEGLLLQKPEVVRSIFSEFFPPIASFVRTNSGTDEDARDVFMYALEVVYIKLKANDLILTAGFFTYLFEVCRRQWLKNIRRNKFDAGVTPDDPAVSNQMAEEQDNEFSEKTERQRLFTEQFKQLAKDCQMVLSFSWHTEMNMEEVANAMGWTYAYARKRKHECKENLINAVKADRRYNELRA
jgi:RNA polymerase sigma factor (sigma-70 family)